MSYVTWRIDRIPFVNGNWDENDKVTLTNFQDVMLMSALGDKKDNFKFVVTNTNNEFDNYFQPEDKIYIYRAVDTDIINESTDLLMIGVISNPKKKDSYNVNSFTVEGFNYSEIVSRAIVFVDGTNRSIPTVLEEAVINAGNTTNFQVVWKSTNPTLTTSGTPFPNVNERFFHKPLMNLLEKYSRRQATGDGTYYWYINANNELVWEPQSSATTYTFNSTTNAYKDLKFDKDIKGIINFVIIKGGLDPEGKPIQIPVRDQASVNKHGSKYKFIVSETNQAQSINNADVIKSNNGDTNVTSRYPASYPFTTTWTSSITKTVEGVNMTKGSQVTVNSDKEYVGVVREHIINLLEEEGRAYIDMTKYGKLKVDLTFTPNQVVWGLGDNIDCTIPSISSTAKVMRVVEIQRTTNEDIYSLEEDIGTLT